MKRSRDDVLVSSQAKRPAISPRIEQPGQVQMSTASSAQRLTTNDALSYLKNVKENFQDRRDKYEEFLDVMKDFKAQRIDTSGVILRVKELFKGNRDLILGFNTFLPKGYEITLPLEDEPVPKKKPVEFEEAISFVNKIKTRFQGDDHVYKAFLDILNMYKKDNKSIREVYQEVSVLFQDHPDLLVEFTHFLPDTSGSASVNYVQPVRNHIVPGDDRGSPMTIARSTYVEKKPAVCDRYINHRDSEQWNHVEKEKEKEEDMEKNEWEQDDNLGHNRKSARHDDSAAEQFHRGMQDMESAFREKVKDQLQDPEIDEKFSDCIRSFKSKFFTAAQFQKLVTSLLGTDPVILEACEDFVTYMEKNGSLRNNRQVFRSVKVDRDGDDHDREDREKNKDYYIRERDRHERGLASNAKDFLGQKMPSYASKEKFMTKPIQELDLSNCESCTPSYRLLPENYPIPSASWRTEIGNEVLNDRWVSVTSGSEDYSFKHMRKNQYEESLFRCEDDRFELDMLIESVNATAKCVEELIDSMNDNKSESTLCSEDHLTALNLRCIERLYGDHGLDVMDVLRKNAPLALPVILTRLKQKQDEWARCRADFNKVWAEIYAQNYHKSLDHRSFYFKQQDAKNLSAKALLAEIKEMSEKNQSEDEMVLSISATAGHKQPIKPDMEFEYPDLDILEDVYQLIRYSCREVCTPEQCDKIMKLWSAFFEPMLCVPSHPPSVEDNSYGVKAKNHIKQNCKIVVEENNSHSDEAAYCKSSAMPKNGGEHFLPEDIVTSKNNVLCNASPGTAEDKSINGENASALATLKGTDQAKSDCGTEPIPSQESQDGVITNLTTYSIGTAPEEVKEEGELSPNRNLEEKNVAASGNTDTKVMQTPCKSDPNTRGIGEEQMCIDEAGEETDVNADDESAQGSSESEHASENRDVSGCKPANGEECSPEEPGEVGAHDKKGESEGEAYSIANVNDTEGTMPFPDCLLQTVKPFKMAVPKALYDKERNFLVFYGSDSFYLLLRLHQMLYERMHSAKLHSSSSENKWRILNDVNPIDSYARFKSALLSLLNGSYDNAKFEDECRAIIGAQSYILFTLDKLIHKIVKQLQIIVTDEEDKKLLHVHRYESFRSPGTYSDAVYYWNARFFLPEDNLYRIESFPTPKRLTIQMMKNDHDKLDPLPLFMDPYFASYLNNELLPVVPVRKANPGVFLNRNKNKNLSGDEMSDTDKALEGVIIHNGVELKVDCNSLKATYVLGTEDFMYRPRKRRRALYGSGSSSGASNGCPRRAKHRKLMLS